jgi:hypothetical protein
LCHRVGLIFAATTGVEVTMNAKLITAALFTVAFIACGAPDQTDQSNVSVDQWGISTAPSTCDPTKPNPHVCDPSDTKKTTICHIPPGNPSNAHTLCVGSPAVPAHLAHGDKLAPCACGPNGTEVPPTGGTIDNPNGSGGGINLGSDGGTSSGAPTSGTPTSGGVTDGGTTTGSTTTGSTSTGTDAGTGIK